MYISKTKPRTDSKRCTMRFKFVHLVGVSCLFFLIMLQMNGFNVYIYQYQVNDFTDRTTQPTPKKNYNYGATPEPKITNEAKPKKQILLWTDLYTKPDKGLSVIKEAMERHQCSDRCSISADRDHLHKADAVMIRTFLDRDMQDLPQRSDPNQIFVFINYESQLRSSVGKFSSNLSDYFNLTLTYMSTPDTDIKGKYGVTRKREHPRPDLLPNEEELSTKSKKVMWMVSYCNAPSLRNQYVKELAKHIKVDIYGKCGKKICQFTNSSCDAIDQLSQQYRFYLAFENSFCNDYITEKPFRTLTLPHPMVPVVMGRGDYLSELPPSSYIDVQDFASPRHLANRLNFLATNVNEYASYFSWRRDYEVQMRNLNQADGYCKLCDILHTDEYPYKRRFDAGKYFSAKENCLQGEELKKAVHFHH